MGFKATLATYKNDTKVDDPSGALLITYEGGSSRTRITTQERVGKTDGKAGTYESKQRSDFGSPVGFVTNRLDMVDIEGQGDLISEHVRDQYDGDASHVDGLNRIDHNGSPAFALPFEAITFRGLGDDDASSVKWTSYSKRDTGKGHREEGADLAKVTSYDRSALDFNLGRSIGAAITNYAERGGRHFRAVITYPAQKAGPFAELLQERIGAQIHQAAAKAGSGVTAKYFAISEPGALGYLVKTSASRAKEMADKIAGGDSSVADLDAKTAEAWKAAAAKLEKVRGAHTNIVLDMGRSTSDATGVKSLRERPKLLAVDYKAGNEVDKAIAVKLKGEGVEINSAQAGREKELFLDAKYKVEAGDTAGLGPETIRLVQSGQWEVMGATGKVPVRMDEFITEATAELVPVAVALVEKIAKAGKAWDQPLFVNGGTTAYDTFVPALTEALKKTSFTGEILTAADIALPVHDFAGVDVMRRNAAGDALGLDPDVIRRLPSIGADALATVVLSEAEYRDLPR